MNVPSGLRPVEASFRTISIKRTLVAILHTYPVLHLQLADRLLLGQAIVVVAVEAALVTGFLRSVGALGEGAVRVATLRARGVLALFGGQCKQQIW